MSHLPNANNSNTCSFQLVQRIICSSITVCCCLEAAVSLVGNRRIRTSRPMQLHTIGALSWAANVILYAVSFSYEGTIHTVFAELSLVFDVLARSLLIFNIYTRTCCVMVTSCSRMRKAYGTGAVLVISWVIISTIALFVSYLAHPGYFQTDPANIMYVVGIIIDLVFCVSSDYLFIHGLRKAKHALGLGLTDRKDILVILNMVCIGLIQIASVVLLFVGIDEEYMYHYVCTALRYRFFVYILRFTDDYMGNLSEGEGTVGTLRMDPEAIDVDKETTTREISPVAFRNESSQTVCI
ncbi:uncharacterized protein SPPG_05743 [Spizellomyces punctatus DAOM BR117]|uniref:Uncharacterized protein n=1 Tax=Spizellomyces punctatus (strain DAOM BR117) TaxID=645134 RepID=A0A0L0HCQ8_SPIPD|nr:uncharacterized protein SPPG_05743 [Spizellomyces punctatus DAOM BR117]KNC98761.1 hypothetical protein SPPG_05743 [Spizellomyces punctatus DAOM BR117]|eukprot:XP_016606801.1 hypothetical protein SPPG_05743 [Spizellomyces punctatus DAOM BR117]